MLTNEKIKTAFIKGNKVFTLKPERGKVTALSRTIAKDGLTCEVNEGDWKFKVDLPESAGGNNQGPTPGVFGRAAFGSCLAITYLMYASHRDITIHELSVDVEADYDDAILFGVGDGPAGYSELRYTVNIVTDADEETITNLINESEKASTYLDVFRDPQKVNRTINLKSQQHVNES